MVYLLEASWWVRSNSSVKTLLTDFGIHSILQVLESLAFIWKNTLKLSGKSRANESSFFVGSHSGKRKGVLIFSMYYITGAPMCQGLPANSSISASPARRFSSNNRQDLHGTAGQSSNLHAHESHTSHRIFNTTATSSNNQCKEII